MGLSVQARIIIKFLEENGYVFVRSRGTSHRIYGKNGLTVSVPVHQGHDVPLGTAVKILKIAGYDRKIFEKWLGR